MWPHYHCVQCSTTATNAAELHHSLGEEPAMQPTTSPRAVQDQSDAMTGMRRMFDEGFATGETAVVDELCAADLVEHQFGMAGVGADAIEHVKQAIREVHRTTPDISFTIEDSDERGDTIGGRGRARGPGPAPFFGPPGGGPVDLPVVGVARVVGGRIVEHWGVPDRFAL